MQLRNGIQTLDAYRPTFDPHLDIATVVFSHVQCVKTRHSLARVSRIWRDASKTAAAYPLRFDSTGLETHRRRLGLRNLCQMGSYQEIEVRLVDNDAALSLPSDRVFKLLGSAGMCFSTVCASQQVLDIQEWLYDNAAALGSITLLKWAQKNGCVMRAHACQAAASNGHLHALRWLRENGCPWDEDVCSYAARGSFETLQWLWNEGLVNIGNEETCAQAARGGCLETLQWCREKGFPWDFRTPIAVRRFDA